MKAKRFLLLLLVLVSVIAVLASCGDEPDSTTEADATTTAPVTTTEPNTTTEPAVTTAPVTTEAPTTTAEPPVTSTVPVTTAEPPVTTTAPAPATQPPVTTTTPVTTAAPAVVAPFKKVQTLSSGALRITFEDGTMNTLGFISLREGYNSAEVTAYSLDKATGILSLTIRESAAVNTANIFLENAPVDVTLRLREYAGNLEWASADAEDWQVLCTKGASKALEQLATAAGIGKHAAVTPGTGTILAIGENSLRFRATEWRTGYHLVNDAVYSRDSHNRFFNLSAIREVPESLAINSVSTSGLTNWKGTGDDITPVNINGTYIGANHGYNIIAKIPNPGKTENDIGSVWQKSDGQQFVLVYVTASELWLCPFDNESMASGNFAKYAAKQLISAGDVLTHVETDYGGAENTFKITAAAGNPSDDMQFYVAVNHVVRRAFVDGLIEVDPTVDGAYEGEFIDFYESYDIIYLPTMLEYLMENVGRNDNDSHHTDKLTESYMTFHNTYRFHKNGATVVYTSYEVKKDIVLSIFAGVQSGAFSPDEAKGEGHYVYVPGTTTYAKPTLQTNSQFYVGTGSEKDGITGNLANPDRLVTSYFQMTKPDGSKAMNLGFCPEFGYGIDENRREYLGINKNAGSNLAFYFTSHKMYPKLLSNTTMTTGTVIDFISYRIPTNKTDEDFTAINWYWVDDVIYLSLHTDKAVAERTVTLPEYMNGMTATVIEGSTSFTVVSDMIKDNTVTVSSTDAGYAIIKLTPAK